MRVSPRTLIRRLKKWGTSFQAISDRLYAQTAADYMNRTDISVNGVAQLLGYKDPANFRRSFMRWFQMTPASYRKTHC
jgi:AraC-like DNA-binding protein